MRREGRRRIGAEADAERDAHRDTDLSNGDGDELSERFEQLIGFRAQQTSHGTVATHGRGLVSPIRHGCGFGAGDALFATSKFEEDLAQAGHHRRVVVVGFGFHDDHLLKIGILLLLVHSMCACLGFTASVLLPASVPDFPCGYSDNRGCRPCPRSGLAAQRAHLPSRVGPLGALRHRACRGALGLNW